MIVPVFLNVATFVLPGAHVIALQLPVTVPVTAVGYLRITIPEPPFPADPASG